MKRKKKNKKATIKVRGLRGWEIRTQESVLKGDDGKAAAVWYDIYNEKGKVAGRLWQNELVYLGDDNGGWTTGQKSYGHQVDNPEQAARYIFLMTQKPIKSK